MTGILLNGKLQPIPQDLQVTFNVTVLPEHGAHVNEIREGLAEAIEAAAQKFLLERSNGFTMSAIEVRK